MLPLMLLFLLILVPSTHQTLSVYNLQALGESNKAFLNISYSIANYGFVPFGKTIIARLRASPTFSNECIAEGESSIDYQDSFMLIPRGACEFVTKSLNAQKLGAQMAIIIDDQKHENMVIMGDNGYGYKVKIPSIFINYEQGELLKNLIIDSEDDPVIIKITFDNSKTSKVNLIFYLQSNNRHVYKLVSEFRSYYSMIKDYVNFQVVYNSISCMQCMEEDCYFNKNYCAINLIHDYSASGKDILNQQLREQIILQEYPLMWWKFMKDVGNYCSILSQFQLCSNEIMKQHNINSTKIQTLLNESFNPQKDNTFLKRNKERLTNVGVNVFPTVTINGYKVTGNLYAEFIFDDICNTLSQPPKDCTRYLVEEKFSTHVSNQWSTILIVILIGLVIFSVIFVLYRRHMRKKITGEMQERVDDMVSKYIEFHSERRGNQ